MITVAVDGMGGDNAPACMVQGAVDAINKNSSIKVLLTGRPDDLNKALEGLTYDKSRLEIVPASEVIETGAPPVESVRTKKDSSLVVGLKLVKEQKADAFVSCGSTEARSADCRNNHCTPEFHNILSFCPREKGRNQI